MLSTLREIARRCAWIILALSLILDGAMGEAAISGYGDVGYLTSDGRFSHPGPDPSLWPWIAGLILVQAGLILAIIRLQTPSLALSLRLRNLDATQI
jgi:hypothetical protein